MLEAKLKIVLTSAHVQSLLIPPKFFLKLSSLLANFHRIYCLYIMSLRILEVVVNRIKKLLIFLNWREDFLGKLFFEFSWLDRTLIFTIRMRDNFVDRDKFSFRFNFSNVNFLIGDKLSESSIEILDFLQLI